MNKTIKTIKQRRSIRKYKDKKISKEILKDLVDCGRWAPSARNDQPYEFIVITEKETLTKLKELIPNGPFIGDANACIVIFGKENGHLVEDGCAATQNILLGAHSLGIGTCWVAGLNRDYNEAVKKLLNIPTEMNVISFIPLGYPDEEARKPSKKDIEEITHWEKY